MSDLPKEMVEAAANEMDHMGGHLRRMQLTESALTAAGMPQAMACVEALRRLLSPEAKKWGGTKEDAEICARYALDAFDSLPWRQQR